MISGLDEKEVEVNRKKYGSNVISGKNNNSFFRLLIESLSDPIIKILFVALAFKVVVLFKDFDWYETLGILIAIFLASFISSISEYGSNKAFLRLQEEYQLYKTKVIRSGKTHEIYAKDVVVGDVLRLESGDKIPADCVILKGTIFVDESFITGESKEIEKDINSKCYSGSTIYDGFCYAKVILVGDKTYIGKISKELTIKNDASPLKKKLIILAKSISKLGYLGAIFASVTYLFYKIVILNGFDLQLIINTVTDYRVMLDYLIYCLTLSVTIVIMAVPEGLPMMITLVLSSNMKKMLKDNVMVRKLSGIEASGQLSALLCDKTGTLTEGKLRCEGIYSFDGKRYLNVSELKSDSLFGSSTLKALYFNVDATIENSVCIGGNLTDRAIKNFLGDFTLSETVSSKEKFNSKKKYSSVTIKNETYYLGACEVFMGKTKYYMNSYGKITPFLSNDFSSLIYKYTSAGKRVLGTFLKREDDSYILLGLVVIADFPRKNARESIENIRGAGVNVVMITGDSKDTALAIAKEICLFNPGDVVLTHDDIIALDNEELKKLLPKVRIVARSIPEDKARLVDLYKSLGFVVGMTGDGVNDALALKKSDVGFCLGSGSEVAKEASDIVIMDNNISSIEKAILYGRTIFKSIRKFVCYQLTVNVCALLLSAIGCLIGVVTPITIIQMLWINMIMDTFAGLAFSYEAPLKSYMKEKPLMVNEKIIDTYYLRQIIVNGFSSFFLCVFFLKVPFIRNLFSSYNTFITAFFALFIFMGIINAFLSRTKSLNLFSNILKNKMFLFINLFIFIVQIFIIYKGGDVFRTYGLSLRELGITMLFSLLMLVIDFVFRFIYTIKKPR